MFCCCLSRTKIFYKGAARAKSISALKHVVCISNTASLAKSLPILLRNIAQTCVKTSSVADLSKKYSFATQVVKADSVYIMTDAVSSEKKKRKAEEPAVVASTISPPKQFYRRELPDVCIGFGSEKGKQIFKEALATGYMEGYFGLAAQFRTQDEPAFCGLSSLVMALNTLEVDPKRVWKGVWRWYHEYMLDCCIPIKVVESKGVTLEQMACLAACNTLNVCLVRATHPHTEEEFRNAVKTVVQTTDQVLIVSYSRPALNQTGDGHFSPIAGYHPEKDLVLILDTARFKYPPYWVPVSLLWTALQAADKETGQPRGYMVVSKNDSSPLLVFRISPVISVNMMPQQLQDKSVSYFLKSWNDWLDQLTDSQSDENMWHTGIGELLSALGNLNKSVLTTQVDMKCALPDEHGCVVKDLIQSLEDSELFHIVDEYLQSSDTSVEHSQDNSCCENKSKDMPSGCKKCNFNLDLKTSHFVTMLLLSWPYRKCGSTKSQRLLQLSTSQMLSADVTLRNEVTLLRQQLHAMLGFINDCGDCSSNCKLLD